MSLSIRSLQHENFCRQDRQHFLARNDEDQNSIKQISRDTHDVNQVHKQHFRITQILLPSTSRWPSLLCSIHITTTFLNVIAIEQQHCYAQALYTIALAKFSMPDISRNLHLITAKSTRDHIETETSTQKGGAQQTVAKFVFRNRTP